MALLDSRRILLDPRDELTTTRVLIVRDEAGSALLQFIKRQMDGLRIELGVIQERQVAKHPKRPVATGELTREPVRNGDANQTLTPAGIENHRMKRAQRCDALRNDWVHRGATAHVEERSLAREASPYLSELNRRNVC